jgi:hypothetical protein
MIFINLSACCKRGVIEMKILALGGAALGLAMAAPAYATVYDLNVYDTGFTGSLGTVTVTGQGVSSTLNFDVSLNSNVFFQIQGNGSPNDVFFFDLLKAVGGGGTTPFTGDINTGNAAITTPNAPGGSPGGDYPTGGQFTVVKSLGGLGQGWASGFDYGVTDGDSSATGGNLDYYTGHLIFSLTSTDGSILSLANEIHNSTTIYGAADLRQCPGADPTSGSCTTGPIGFSLSPNQQSATPEPATWATMLLGFGFIGTAMRRRKPHQALRLAYV